MALPILGLLGAAATSRTGIVIIAVAAALVGAGLLVHFYTEARVEGAVESVLRERATEINQQNERELNELRRRVAIMEDEFGSLDERLDQNDLAQQDIFFDLSDEEDGDLAPVSRRALERLRELETPTETD